MGKIYLITSPSGKQYVGLTIQKILNDRLKGHLKKSSNCTFLKRAIEKYGWDNMKVEVLIECDDEHLDYYEKLFIDGYGTLAKSDNSGGYNLKEGGQGGALSEITKEKIRTTIVQKNRENGTLGSIVKRSDNRYRATCTYKNVDYQLGTYDTEEKARKAVDEFYEDPENYERPEQMSRKSGTGRVSFHKPSGKYNAYTPGDDEHGNQGKCLGYYETKEEAERAVDEYLNAEDKTKFKFKSIRQKGTGSVRFKSNTGKYHAFAPTVNRYAKSLGSFKTYKEAEEVLDKYLADNNLV